MEPIEKWREEFESIEKDKMSLDRNSDGSYYWDYIENRFNGFIMAKKSEKVIDLPEPTMHYDSFTGRILPFYRSQTIESLFIDAGIQYRIKGE